MKLDSGDWGWVDIYWIELTWKCCSWWWWFSYSRSSWHTYIPSTDLALQHEWCQNFQINIHSLPAYAASGETNTWLDVPEGDGVETDFNPHNFSSFRSNALA
jgi:hypothetical protein